MTSVEFLNEFNLLYNNINSNAAPGLNTFEISQLLTKSQMELIKNSFNPLGNKYKEGFDESIKRQHDFSSILKISVLQKTTADFKIDQRSIAFTPPSDLLFIINEVLTIDTKPIQVLPLTFEEYTRKMLKPYNEPLQNSAWRILGQAGLFEVIPNYLDRPTITDTNLAYKVRYVKTPKPILLEDFSSKNLSIEGATGTGYDFTKPCELPESMHIEIVQRAVELAKAAYQPEEAQIQTQMGTRSE